MGFPLQKPYILHTACLGEYLHFRYLKCLAKGLICFTSCTQLVLHPSAMVPSILMFNDLYCLYTKDGSALSHESTKTNIIRTSSLELSIAHFHVCHLGRSSSYLEPLANPHEFTLDLRKHQNQNISKFKNAISAEVFQTNGRFWDFFQTTTSFFQPKNPQVIIPTPGPPVDNIWKEWLPGWKNPVVSYQVC